MEKKVFGPVPSRRLGKSLGINNIPYKICTYSCAYCQLGKAIKVQVKRQEFYKSEELLNEVIIVLSSLRDKRDYPDYITIVPDGEPTLDINIGVLISKLHTLEIPVAVITNASLINLPDVRRALIKADYISVKADSFNKETWRKINKPHKKLNLDEITSGIVNFREEYSGKLVTETMLIKGINDTYNELKNTARIVGTFMPDIAYISIPTRPPAFKNVIAADESSVNKAYHIFREHIDKVELLTDYEGSAFASTGNFKDDLLSITAVHPMREDAVLKLMYKEGDNKDILNTLLKEKLLEKTQYNGYNYYMRKFTK
jgi:wyosine [tRNA(Phe)-imidazoG37] synthetase (radical SAM superfamily)